MRRFLFLYYTIMWKALSNFSNRISNTALIAPRLGYTGLNAGTDVIDTLAAIPRDFLDVVQYTAHGIKDVLASAWTTWKRYQRVWNIIKSPFVAMWAAVEWAVKSVVTPGINELANAWNTGKNTVKNAWRSTFGRVFSKKPVSDFSYNSLKTANVIQKNKNWFINRWFSRKSMEWYKWIISEKWNIQDNKWKAAAAAAVVPIVVPTKTTRTKKDVEVADSWSTIRDKMNKALESTKSSLKETFALKDDKWEITSKTETKTAKPSKVEEVKKEKIEKWETTKWITKDKPETKSEKAVESTEKKDSSKTAIESLDTEAKRKWLDEAKKLVENSVCWQKILDWLSENYKDFWVVFDDNVSFWKHDKENNIIVIWAKLPKEMSGLAPFNWDEKDPEYQKRHVLLHELAHCTIISHKDKIPEIQKWLDIIEKYIDKDTDGKTLSLLSYKNDTYKTNKDKAKEDFVEILALAMNWKWTACKKYMELLSDDEHKEFREKNGLATITKDDAEALENACKAVVKFYELKKD